MLKHILLGIAFGIYISFISWIVGMVINAILVNTRIYKHISHLNFIKSDAINQNIGIERFAWIIKNTFFKYFNQKIKFEARKIEFLAIRKEMTIAEVSHLIAFVFVCFFAIYYGSRISILYGLMILIVNIFMNLYPSLLQQKNKRRIDELIKRQARSIGTKE